MTALFAGSTAIVITRPEVTAGPIDRALSPANVSEVKVCDAAGRPAIARAHTMAPIVHFAMSLIVQKLMLSPTFMIRGETIVCGTKYVAPTPLLIESAVCAFIRLKMSNCGTRRRPGPNRNARDTRRSTSVTSRSEEHTSELQSRGHLVCRLLLEK